MLRKLITTAIAALALLALSPDAKADPFTGKKYKRADAGAPAKRNWTGFYAGVNLGYGFAGITDSAPLAVTTMMYGAVAGVQAGYNYQIDQLVLGVEFDVQASNQSQEFTRALPLVGNLTVGHKIPYFATTRARIGYAFSCGCVMAYGTIGAAYGDYQPYASAFGVTVSTTYSKPALAFGVGVEWAVAERWTAKIEGLYLDTGNVGSAVALPIIGPINARLRDMVMRLGVNYRF